MPLVWNWKQILIRAWSVRFMALTILFTILEVALPFYEEAIPPRAFALLTVFTAVAALVTRLIPQPVLYEGSRNGRKDED